jgi:peptidoglycan/LPS O-acetylase OafA/YrhL
MWQRIQTLYMFLAAIAGILLAGVLTLWQGPEGDFKALDNPVYAFLAGAAAGMLLANIFNYKKRKLQIVLNRAAMLAFLVAAGFMIYEYVALVTSGQATGPGLGLVMPLLAIILIVMANRGITKDEELVQSANRFR